VCKGLIWVADEQRWKVEGESEVSVNFDLLYPEKVEEEESEESFDFGLFDDPEGDRIRSGPVFYTFRDMQRAIWQKWRSDPLAALWEECPEMAAAPEAVKELYPGASQRWRAKSGDWAVYVVKKMHEAPTSDYRPYSNTFEFALYAKDNEFVGQIIFEETICQDCEDHDVKNKLQVGDFVFKYDVDCGRDFSKEVLSVHAGGKLIASWTSADARGGRRTIDYAVQAGGISSGLAVLCDIAQNWGMGRDLNLLLELILRLPGGSFCARYMQEDMLQHASIYLDEFSESGSDFGPAVAIHAVKFPRPITSHGGNRMVCSESWGLSCQQFYRFINRCKASPKWKELSESVKVFGGDQGWVNGYEMCEEFVRPYTRGTGNGVSLSLNAETPLQAQIMLSHSWAESMGEVLVALLNFPALTPETVMWFCIFANYQCGDEPGDCGPTVTEQLSQDPFGRVIRQPSLIGMCVIQTSTAEVYERLWCVYEIAEAVHSGVFVCSVTCAAETRMKLQIDVVDTSGAKCGRAEDDAMIRAKIEEQGGFERLNETINDFRKHETKNGAEARRLLEGV